MSNFSATFSRLARTFAAIAVAALSCGAAAGADSVYPTSIAVYPYPVVASPSKIPVTVIGCGVFRLRHRLHVGFSFRNLELDPMTAVKISVDLYDPFHAFLTTLDATINGDYAPGAQIDVPEVEGPGDRMPAFEAFDLWPSAASAVCYVSSVAYANGAVWNASERPSLDVASRALGDYTKNAAANGRKHLNDIRAEQHALGFKTTSIEPSPNAIPSGWKALATGAYMDGRNITRGIHVLTFVALTGAGGNGTIAPSDIPAVHEMEQIEIVGRHATTVCGNRPAEFLTLTGTTSAGPQTVEAIKVRTSAGTYVSSYTRSFGTDPSAEAEDVLTHICY